MEQIAEVTKHTKISASKLVSGQQSEPYIALLRSPKVILAPSVSHLCVCARRLAQNLACSLALRKIVALSSQRLHRV